MDHQCGGLKLRVTFHFKPGEGDHVGIARTIHQVLAGDDLQSRLGAEFHGPQITPARHGRRHAMQQDIDSGFNEHLVREGGKDGRVNGLVQDPGSLHPRRRVGGLGDPIAGFLTGPAAQFPPDSRDDLPPMRMKTGGIRDAPHHEGTAKNPLFFDKQCRSAGSARLNRRNHARRAATHNNHIVC